MTNTTDNLLNRARQWAALNGAGWVRDMLADERPRYPGETERVCDAFAESLARRMGWIADATR